MKVTIRKYSPAWWCVNIAKAVFGVAVFYGLAWMCAVL